MYRHNILFLINFYNMPLRNNIDNMGPYYQWGNNRKRYYYHDEESRRKAKQKAIIQGYAIEKSEERQGKPNDLRKSKYTGRMTHLEGINRSKHRKNNRQVY